MALLKMGGERISPSSSNRSYSSSGSYGDPCMHPFWLFFRAEHEDVEAKYREEILLQSLVNYRLALPAMLGVYCAFYILILINRFALNAMTSLAGSELFTIGAFVCAILVASLRYLCRREAYMVGLARYEKLINLVGALSGIFFFVVPWSLLDFFEASGSCSPLNCGLISVDPGRYRTLFTYLYVFTFASAPGSRLPFKTLIIASVAGIGSAREAYALRFESIFITVVFLLVPDVFLRFAVGRVFGLAPGTRQPETLLYAATARRFHQETEQDHHEKQQDD